MGAIRQQVQVLPPIYRDAKRLLIMIEQAVMSFARYHRYSIGADLRQQAIKVLRLVHRALREKSQQTKHVKNLVWALDDLRLSLQLAKEPLAVFKQCYVFYPNAMPALRREVAAAHVLIHPLTNKNYPVHTQRSLYENLSQNRSLSA